MEQDRVGQKLGNYVLQSVLGNGGFATVYLGEHAVLGSKRQAAVKVLKTVELTETTRDKFLKEARTIARLVHPNIIRVMECGVDIETNRSTPYIAMSYASKGNVRNEYPHDTILPFDIILSYTKQAAEALQYAHDQNIVHCDVKPENILLGGPKQILLADFGIANISHTADISAAQHGIYTDSSPTDEVQGTVTYMAPERFQGVIRRSSDQYSLGVVVYEWLTGSPPFTGSREKIIYDHLTAQPSSLRALNPQVSPDVEQVVLKALEKEADKRYSSVKEFADALERALLPLLSSTPTPPTQAPFTVPEQRKRELSAMPTTVDPRSFEPEISAMEPPPRPINVQPLNARNVQDHPDSSLSSLQQAQPIPPTPVGTQSSAYKQEVANHQDPSQQDEPAIEDSISVQPLLIEDALNNVDLPLPRHSVLMEEAGATFVSSPPVKDAEASLEAPSWTPPSWTPPAEEEDAVVTFVSTPSVENTEASPEPALWTPPPAEEDATLSASAAQPSQPMKEATPAFDALSTPDVQSKQSAQTSKGAHTAFSSASTNSGNPWATWSGRTISSAPDASNGSSTQQQSATANSISSNSGSAINLPDPLDMPGNRQFGGFADEKENTPSLTSLGDIVAWEPEFASQPEWRRFRQGGFMANLLCAIACGLLVHSWSIFFLGLLTLLAFWLCIRLIKPIATGTMSLAIALYWGYFGFALSTWIMKSPMFSSFPAPWILCGVFFIISIGSHINYLNRRLA